MAIKQTSRPILSRNFTPRPMNVPTVQAKMMRNDRNEHTRGYSENEEGPFTYLENRNEHTRGYSENEEGPFTYLENRNDHTMGDIEKEEEISHFIDLVLHTTEQFKLFLDFEKDANIQTLIEKYINYPYKNEFVKLWNSLYTENPGDTEYKVFEDHFIALWNVEPKINGGGGQGTFVTRNEYISSCRHGQCQFLHKSQIGKDPYSVIRAYFRPNPELVQWLKRKQVNKHNGTIR
jgi:hypothetical protein